MMSKAHGQPSPRGLKRSSDGALKVASACSGMGTESFALQRTQVPHRLVLASELQPTLRQFPQRNRDPETLVPDCTTPEFLQAGVGADIFVAGFPCQSFSQAGRNLGVEDARGRVVTSLIKWLRAHQPAAFILENVKGLLHFHPKVFRAILRKLGGIHDSDTNEGCYHITWDIVNSRDHGVPQAAQRMLRIAPAGTACGCCCVAFDACF